MAANRDRAAIMAINKSIRTIKTELENLSERNAITDEQYDTLMAHLPEEASLKNTSLPIPGPNSNPSPAPRTASFDQLSLNNTRDNPMASPPSYVATPPLPARNTPAPPPPGPPEIAHAVALYRYVNESPQDCDLEVNDHISVTKYVNADWWEGTNIRTGASGIFPKIYVRVENSPSSLASGAKAGFGYPGQPQYGQPQYHQGPPPPGPSDPYAGPVPPMQIAEQPVEVKKGSKGMEMGKKFGSKLGNAAIFGAGATMGADLVNSIF